MTQKEELLTLGNMDTYGKICRSNGIEIGKQKAKKEFKEKIMELDKKPKLGLGCRYCPWEELKAELEGEVK